MILRVVLSSRKRKGMDLEQVLAERSGVLITGMAGRLGKRLVRRLHRSRQVFGLDSKAASDLPKDVSFEPLDPLRSGARQMFRRPEIGAIVHLGVIHDPRTKRAEAHSRNLLMFQRVLEYAEKFEIPKIVLLSSGNTYGPRPENAQFLTEQAPLLAGGQFTEMHALVELDMYAQSFFWRSPKTELVILRPANILGTVRNAPSNYLRLQMVPTLLGFDPMVQAVHQDDVARAIELALRPGARGIYNIAGPPAVPLSKAIQILGRTSVPVPYTLAKTGLGGLFRLGLSRFPSPELDFIRYVCMVDDALARAELGYVPAHDLEATLRAVDEERWA
jgi:UDP-glucose 4-epimerase